MEWEKRKREERRNKSAKMYFISQISDILITLGGGREGERKVAPFPLAWFMNTPLYTKSKDPLFRRLEWHCRKICKATINRVLRNRKKKGSFRFYIPIRAGGEVMMSTQSKTPQPPYWGLEWQCRRIITNNFEYGSILWLCLCCLYLCGISSDRMKRF